MTENKELLEVVPVLERSKGIRVYVKLFLNHESNFTKALSDEEREGFQHLIHRMLEYGALEIGTLTEGVDPEDLLNFAVLFHTDSLLEEAAAHIDQQKECNKKLEQIRKKLETLDRS